MAIQWNLFQCPRLPLLFKQLQVCEIITRNSVTFFV